MTTKPKSKDLKIPKDLKVVMGTELERNWTGVRDSAKAAVKAAEFTITLQLAVMRMADDKIRSERIKFKRR